jgi:hypothetical protein
VGDGYTLFVLVLRKGFQTSFIFVEPRFGVYVYIYICICGNKIESYCRIIILRRLLYVKSLAACTL